MNQRKNGVEHTDKKAKNRWNSRHFRLLQEQISSKEVWWKNLWGSEGRSTVSCSACFLPYQTCSTLHFVLGKNRVFQAKTSAIKNITSNLKNTSYVLFILFFELYQDSQGSSLF